MDDKLNEIAFLDDVVRELVTITKKVNKLSDIVIIRSQKAAREIKDFETRLKISEMVSTTKESEKEKALERENYLR